MNGQQQIQQYQGDEEEGGLLIVDSLPVSFMDRARFFLATGVPLTGGLLLLGTGGFAPVIGGIAAGVIAAFAGEIKEMGSEVLHLTSGIRPTVPHQYGIEARRGDHPLTNDEDDVEEEGQEEEDDVPASIMVPEPAVLATPVATAKTMKLARNFLPDADEIVGEGIVVFGSKGSGKTNVGALLAEEFSRFYLPMVIFDIEGDYASTVPLFKNGYTAGAAPLPEGHQHQHNKRYAHITPENAYEAGFSIIEHGCQVVFDLSSYESDEESASVMIEVVKGLTAWANAQPSADRVPCLVFLDEAAYWLPQVGVSYIQKETQKALRDTFHVLATKGRKRGLTPILLTQRISELHKDVMAQANIYLLGKQSLDNDLDRYTDYVKREVATREQIAAFGPGQFIVKLADGTQFITQFYERRSKHISHTPKVGAAVARYAATGKRPTLHMNMTMTPATPMRVATLPPMEPLKMRTPPSPVIVKEQEEQDMPVAQQKPMPMLSPEIQCALDTYHTGMGYRELGQRLQVGKDTAGKYIQRLKDMGLISPDGKKMVARRLDSSHLRDYDAHMLSSQGV